MYVCKCKTWTIMCSNIQSCLSQNMLRFYSDPKPDWLQHSIKIHEDSCNLSQTMKVVHVWRRQCWIWCKDHHPVSERREYWRPKGRNKFELFQTTVSRKVRATISKLYLNSVKKALEPWLARALVESASLFVERQFFVLVRLMLHRSTKFWFSK